MENDDDLVVPYHVLDERLGDDEDTEQHKALRGRQYQKKSIKHYRHATGKWSAALEGFKPLWFAICISSGGLALILNSPFPYQGYWQVKVATILYVLDLVLFLLFMAAILARWIIYPHAAVRRALSDPDELGAYAIPPIALLTIAALTASQTSNSWGGYSTTLLAYVLWWIGAAWMFTTAVVVLTVLFYTGNQSDRVMTPVIFMAPVGLATVGTEAGFITINGYGMSSRLAVPQLVVAYFGIGMALFVAIILYAMYMHRLFAAGWPVGPKRPSLFVLIGACGQLSTAFQILGSSASAYMNFARYKPNDVHLPEHATFFSAETARGIDGAGILLALLLLGFGYLWVTLAFIGVIDSLIKKQAKYSLIWWSLVFPTVTLTTAWLELSRSMDSPAFRVLTSISTVFITIVYFLNWGFTLYGTIFESLLFGETQLELEASMIEKARTSTANGTKREV